MQGVVGLPYVLPTVTQIAVAEQKAAASEAEIFGMVTTDAVCDECGAHLV